MSDKWEKRMKAEGRCIKCGAKLAPDSSNFCPRHRNMHRERNRIYAKRKRANATIEILQNSATNKTLTAAFIIALSVITPLLLFVSDKEALLRFSAVFLLLFVILGFHLKFNRGEP